MASEYRKKLIEVALPLEAINREASKEKNNPFHRSHPRNIHAWWARLPLVACRAVLFASLVDDPSAWPDLFPTEEEQEAERERLFEIIEQLVKWENSSNEAVLSMAQIEIARSISRNLHDDLPEAKDAIRKYLEKKAPPLLDPFCGGGSIPIEAQRLGLEAYGSDLNPIPVLITKALIEIPPRFDGLAPVNREAREKRRLTEIEWNGAEGIADDVRYYSQWMSDQAEKRIGHLYPRIKVTKEMTRNRPDLGLYVGQELTVIAWLWARTVKCANPACGSNMPLISTFWLSKKKGKETWIKPEIDRSVKTVRFEVGTGDNGPPDPPKVGRGAKFKCMVCGELAEDKHIKDEGIKGRMSSQMMAIVAEGKRGRVYLAPDEDQCLAALDAEPTWRPGQHLADDPRNIWCVGYGLDTFDKLFTNRQLVALTTFSDLVKEAQAQVMKDASDAETFPLDDQPLSEGGVGAKAYADAIATYLAFALDKLVDYDNALCSWNPSGENIRHLFSQQAIPMTWDFAETSPLDGGLSFVALVAGVSRAISDLSAEPPGKCEQLDATAALLDKANCLISTDPPYYDNISYSDLSDFFYPWLRRSLSDTYRSLFSTLLTPKNAELIASPSRHNGNSREAKSFFEEGFYAAFSSMHSIQSPQYPLTVYYAFKQAESGGKSKTNAQNGPPTALISTGWETMLGGLIRAGYRVIGTWPLRTAMKSRQVALGTNALASAVVLVCHPRPPGAPMATRREFLSRLKEELPNALVSLQHGSIAPVDLAQASIGPGMAVFTSYSRVMESDGSPMTVRTALGFINQTLDEVLAEQEGEFDADTRWAIAWFGQHGMEEGPFGDAETLSKAKDTAVGGLVEAGILKAKGGKVRLLRREELLDNWDPTSDKRLTVWEAAHHLIRALDQQGEAGTATLLRKLGSGYGERARDLAYRLYNICEHEGWASEALGYNSLVIAWPELTRLARESKAEGFGPQAKMFESE